MTADTMISNLGHVAEDITSRFSCGGKLELPNSSAVKVAYKTTTTTVTQPSTSTGVSTETDEVWSSIKFPGTSKAAITKLLDVCSVASFGYKDKDVIDKNYRDALKLDPTDFATTFQLCNTPIIRQIESLIPNCAGLQAELYMLNIYAPGGFFKPHVDTPRSGQMFGSLVVCLPTQFSGGELVVRHKKKEIKYDWSSPPFNGLQWAAFFSDIEHEVLPITEGYRVTLTYNLYYGTNPSRLLIDITTNPFYRTLHAALSHPIFMRDGGILGYECCYSYVFDIKWADLLGFTEGKEQILSKLGHLPLKRVISYSTSKQVEALKKCGIGDTIIAQILDIIPSSFPRLKGGDSIVFESAKLLNLPVHVKHFLNQDDDKDGYGFAFKSLTYGQFKFSDEMFAEEDPRLEPEFIASDLFGDTACKYKLSDITWCNKKSRWYNYWEDEHQDEPCGAFTIYGNRSMEIVYQRAVILMGIPRWSDRCSTTEKDNATANDGADIVEKCFKDLDHQKYRDMGDYY
ncbi:uncharacterized protein [Dysidea avara]|uniref:uncharacterized protein n=1 Tax=Dysidea avara TaxID=196820 RepID=UPI003322448F